MAASAGYWGIFTPDNAELLGSPASKRKFNGVPIIWMDKEFGVNSPVPEAYWSGFLPGPAANGYSGTTGIKVIVALLCPTGVIAGNVQTAVAFDLKGATDIPGTNTTFPAYGSANEVAAATAINATVAGGILYVTHSVTIAKVQNGQTTAPAIGDWFRLRVRRKVENASDTLTAPVGILGVTLLDY